MLNTNKEGTDEGYACPYKAGHRIQDLVDNVTDEVRYARAYATQEIRRAPLGACLKVAAVAYILGKLTRRR